jgi:hypothetical protein
MMRKIAMLGLVAGFLALGGCDLCCGGDTDAATDAATGGAALQAGEGGESCSECLDAAAMGSGGLAADVAGDAPLTCPMSGATGAQGECGAAKSSCCDAMEDCSEVMEDCSEAKQQCDTPCSEKPATPSVED